MQCAQPPHEGGLDGGLRLAKQAELDKLVALRDAHKRQEKEKKITSKYHKASRYNGGQEENQGKSSQELQRANPGKPAMGLGLQPGVLTACLAGRFRQHGVCHLIGRLEQGCCLKPAR
eukprot:591639-Pelagomonas_calceolata.AAC.1